MDLYPAIDLRGGKVVRLARGDYAEQTTYDDDPVAVARRFDAAGAKWIHVVDLDAALEGGNPNLDLIEAICGSVRAAVQTSGGVRSVDDAIARFNAGAYRVVVGSAAVEDPDMVNELIRLRPAQVAIGLDARGSDVAIHGWTESSGVDLLTLARRFGSKRIGALVVTDISRDGMLTGPALDQLREVVEAVRVPVIASGGVAEADDLRALAALRVGRKQLAGAIVGRAIYENRFTVEEGIAACSAPA